MFHFMLKAGEIFMPRQTETGSGKRFPDIVRGQGQRIKTQGERAAGAENAFPDRQDPAEETVQGFGPGPGLGRVLDAVGQVGSDEVGPAFTEKGRGFHRVGAGKGKLPDVSGLPVLPGIGEGK